MVVCSRTLECSQGVCRRWFSQSADGGFSLCCALILARRETEWGYLFTILHNTYHNVLMLLIRCHSAAALHQVCLCWYKLLGSWRWSPKTSTLLYWYKPFYFLLQVTRSVTTFIQLAFSLTKYWNVFWNKFWYCEILHWRWQTMWPEMGMGIWRLDWDSHGVMCRAHVCSCREWRMQRRHPYGPQLWPNHHDRWVLGKLSWFSKITQ